MVDRPWQSVATIPKAGPEGGEQGVTPERTVPAPEVVNAEVLPKQPADSLDGPPFVTSRAWAIADGRTGSVLWGHREAEARGDGQHDQDHDGPDRRAADGEGPGRPGRGR